jgi:hypothetical protein
VDEPIYPRMRCMSPCENNSLPREPVIVGIPEGTARSHIVLSALPRDQRCGDY